MESIVIFLEWYQSFLEVICNVQEEKRAIFFSFSLPNSSLCERGFVSAIKNQVIFNIF